MERGRGGFGGGAGCDGGGGGEVEGEVEREWMIRGRGLRRSEIWREQWGSHTSKMEALSRLDFYGSSYPTACYGVVHHSKSTIAVIRPLSGTGTWQRWTLKERHS